MDWKLCVRKWSLYCLRPFCVFAWKDLNKVQENSVRRVSAAAVPFEFVAHICGCFECDSVQSATLSYMLYHGVYFVRVLF